MRFIKRIIKRYLKVRRNWSLHNQQLISINSMEEFLNYVDKNNYDTFLVYKDKSNEKREDFNAKDTILKKNVI